MEGQSDVTFQTNIHSMNVDEQVRVYLYAVRITGIVHKPDRPRPVEVEIVKKTKDK